MYPEYNPDLSQKCDHFFGQTLPTKKTDEDPLYTDADSDHSQNSMGSKLSQDPSDKFFIKFKCVTEYLLITFGAMTIVHLHLFIYLVFYIMHSTLSVIL